MPIIPAQPEQLLYYCSKNIVLHPSKNTIFYTFIQYMSMIKPELASQLLYLHYDQEAYNQLFFINRNIIMNVVDILVIENNYILNIKKIIDSRKDKQYNISAIYGSYLAIIYSFILKDIGCIFNPFSKYAKPLSVVDCDTMSIKIIDGGDGGNSGSDGVHDTQFSKSKSHIIGFHKDSDNLPIQNTKVEITYIQKYEWIDILLSKCWDLTCTSSILIYEDDKKPYILRSIEFMDFLFGLQPIKILNGKNELNLQNIAITNFRLTKAIKKWM